MKKTQSKNVKEIKPAIEDACDKDELAQFINENPGVTLNELSDIWSGGDGYDFMQTMLTLFDEYKVVEDIGHYFPDEATRLRMSIEGLY